jgi:hypothetical protein
MGKQLLLDPFRMLTQQLFLTPFHSNVIGILFVSCSVSAQVGVGVSKMWEWHWPIIDNETPKMVKEGRGDY